MKTSSRIVGGPELLILIGSCIFIFILWLSAYFEPDIRWLHFFQAWMYLATIGLALRRNRWGYFIGISAAGLWDYINVFVTTFLRGGLYWLHVWTATGQLQHVDQIIAVPAWSGNFLVLLGCIWAYTRVKEKSIGDLARLLVAFMFTTGFFAAAIALFQPRYLPLFPAIIHPHRPW